MNHAKIVVDLTSVSWYCIKMRSIIMEKYAPFERGALDVGIEGYWT